MHRSLYCSLIGECGHAKPIGLSNSINLQSVDDAVGIGSELQKDSQIVF
jgi:hypothetical protein